MPNETKLCKKWVGHKIKAAKLLYNKESVDVLVDVEYNNVQREIINAALEGHALKIPTGEKVGNIFSASSSAVIRST